MILHLISSDDRRGAQVFATELVAALGGLPDHELVAVEPGRDGGLDVEVLGHRRWDAGGARRLVARARRADVLLAHGSSALLHGAAASAVARRPFVYRNIGDPSAWGRVRGADLRIGLPLRRAAAVSALYPGARDHLVRAYRLDPARVRTIPNGVTPLKPSAEDRRRAARAAVDLDPALTLVGYLGSLSEEKGIEEAVDAVAGRADLGLVVAGAGPLAGPAADRAARTAPGRVRFLGVVADPLDLLDAVDVLVLPSRTEGIPAAAIEAGLAALPVVATAVGGVGEVVEDGVTGVLVTDRSPASLRAGLDAALGRRHELGAAARARCLERFTIDAVAAQWSALLDDVRSGALRR